MKGYPITKLGDLASDEPGAIAIGPFGSRMKAEVYVPEGVPVIRGTNIASGRGLKGDWVYVSEEFSRSIPNCVAKPGDLVFPHRGSIGEVALIENQHGPLVISSSMMKFRPNAKIVDNRYLLYFFKSLDGRNEILRFSSQVGTPGIGQPLTSLRQFRVPLPNLTQQSAIADVLWTLDDKIESNQQLNATLDAMARVIFKDWFIYFGPTRAKMEGRAPYVAPDLWSLFPNRLDDFGKPEGWQEKRVEEIMELAYGKALPSNERVDGKVPVYGSGGITGYHDDALVQGPSIIIGRKGTVGTLYWEDRSFFPIDTVFFVRPKVPLTFCYYHLQTLGLGGMNTDAAVPGLNRNNVYRLTVPWSTEELRTRFDEIVMPLRKRIRANLGEIETLSAVRDLLLPKLMSGEVGVKDVGTHMGDVS